MITTEERALYRNMESELNSESFDTQLRKEMYKAYKEILSQGKSKICWNCMYCDKIKGVCINNLKVEIKMKSCYKARNIYLLKKAGLYGEKRNI